MKDATTKRYIRTHYEIAAIVRMISSREFRDYLRKLPSTPCRMTLAKEVKEFLDFEMREHTEKRRET